MPYSYSYYKPEIKEHFKTHIPVTAKILDVGPGAGCYSDLLRELGYRIDCLEIFEPYIDQFNLTSKYDNVILGDINNFNFSEYDYIIMGDVLEHLTFNDARIFIEKISELNKKCLIAVPYNYEQGDEFGNIYETHLQPDLTPVNVLERYPELQFLFGNELYGYYINYPLTNTNLTWLAKFDDYSSMGILSQKILENLENTNISCKEIIGKTETSNELIHEFIRKPINHELGIMFSYPNMFHELNSFNTKVIYTGVDSTGGIDGFADNCNKVDYLLTPSNLSRTRMINLGVTKPVFVFPHGIDETLFTYTPRIKSDKFKFLYVGECSDRKGIFQLLEAFTKLFRNNTNVELHIKSNNAMLFYNGQDIQEYTKQFKNIFWHISNEGHNRVIKLYQECHAYVYPSRADTFGMTLLEAMACGLPVISTVDPGATELITGRYHVVKSKDVPVRNHPWMLGEWGEPDIKSLMEQMQHVYSNYESLDENILKEHSNYVRTELSWKNLVNKFQTEIMPKLVKKPKVLTLVISNNNPSQLDKCLASIRHVNNGGYDDYLYVVDNSNASIKEYVSNVIKKYVVNGDAVYMSNFDLGKRGSLLQMLEDIKLNDFDYIQIIEDTVYLVEPSIIYSKLLLENQDIFYVTGLMNTEHSELNWRATKYGNLCEKNSLRSSHMFMRAVDLTKLLPIHLDSQFGKEYNSSWNYGLDWELTWWNKHSPGNLGKNNFVLCVPGGVMHYDNSGYSIDELIKMRY